MITKNSKHLGALLCALLLSVLLTGCIAPRTIEAASTKVELVSSTGSKTTLLLPKELKADELAVDFTAGTFRAVNLVSSSQGVIQSAGEIQAATVRDLTGTVNALVGALVPYTAPPPSPPLSP